LRQHDLPRAELRERKHRHSERERLEQHESLCFAARGKHEQVACAVAVLQRAAAIEVADEQHVAAQRTGTDRRAQVILGGALARDHEQHVRQVASHAIDGLYQEVDVLLVRDPAYDQHDGAPAGMPCSRRKRAPSPPSNSDRSRPVGRISIGRSDAVASEQVAAHRR
jgi:hypothetical protein